MARSSSAGLPHFTCRSDAGQFNYHRAFRPEIVAFIEGDVRLSWTRRMVTLGGTKVITVSLGTGDRKLATTRWEELHLSSRPRGCGYVDNAAALTTYPQLQKQTKALAA